MLSRLGHRGRDSWKGALNETVKGRDAPCYHTQARLHQGVHSWLSASCVCPLLQCRAPRACLFEGVSPERSMPLSLFLSLSGGHSCGICAIDQKTQDGATPSQWTGHHHQHQPEGLWVSGPTTSPVLLPTIALDTHGPVPACLLPDLDFLPCSCSRWWSCLVLTAPYTSGLGPDPWTWSAGAARSPISLQSFLFSFHIPVHLCVSALPGQRI